MMFDFDGDGDIDEFDEELMVEYELQLMEDELIFNEIENRRNRDLKRKKDNEKSCFNGILIAIGVSLVLIFVVGIV